MQVYNETRKTRTANITISPIDDKLQLDQKKSEKEALNSFVTKKETLRLSQLNEVKVETDISEKSPFLREKKYYHDPPSTLKCA